MPVLQKKWGVILRYIQLIANVVIKFIYTPFLLRALGQNEYGLYSLTMSIVGYLAILDLGFGSTVTRFTVKYKEENDKPKLYGLYSTLSVIYIIIGLLAMLICFALSMSASHLFGSTMSVAEVSKLKLMILLCGINLLFSFPLQISASVLTAYERFVVKHGVTLIFTFLQPIVMIALLYLVNMKSVGAIVVVTSCNLLTYLCYYVYAVKKLDFKFSLRMVNPGMIKGLLTFSVWMFLMMLFEQLQYNSGQFIIGLFQGADIVAIWGIAMIFILNYRSISTAITNVFLPSFMAVSFAKDYKSLENSIYKMTHIQTLTLVFIMVNFVLFGKLFIHIWAGGEYDASFSCALIVMIAMTPALLLDFCYLYQLASNQLMYRTITIFSSFIVSFLLIYLWKGINLQSYALVMALSIVVGQIVFVAVFIKKNIPVQFGKILHDIIRVCWMPLLMGLLFIICNHFWIHIDNLKKLIVYGVFFNTILLLFMWKFSLTEDDKRLIFRKQLSNN